jgi:hypothetical protein
MNRGQAAQGVIAQANADGAALLNASEKKLIQRKTFSASSCHKHHLA